MAKITAYIPEPKEQYDVSNQRQILESVSTCLLYTSPSPRD